MKIPVYTNVKERKINMGIKNWQASMFSAMRVAMFQNRFDLLNLYLKLEKASKKYLETGEMQEGDSFRVPLEVGTILNIEFYKNYSTVIAEHPDNTKEIAISEKDSYKKEYRYLDAFSTALRLQGLGIGPKRPEEFMKTIKNAKVGDVFVFDHGKSLLCTTVFKQHRNFVETCGMCNIPSVDEFKKQKEYSVDTTNMLSLQELYRDVKDPYSCNIKMSITSITEARGILNSLLRNRDITKELTIGPNRFIIQPSKEGKGLIYYDQTGKQISEEKILLLLSWLEANPNKIEVKDIRPQTPMTEIDNIMFKQTVDEYMSKHEFEAAVKYIACQCMESPEVLQVDMKSYVRNDLDYEAVSFCFKCEDEKITIKKLTYEDNDFSKSPSAIENASMEDVVRYCEKKYDERFTYVKSSFVEDVCKEFPQWESEKVDKFSNNYVEKVMKDLSIIDMNFKHADSNISSIMGIDFEKAKNKETNTENNEEEYEEDKV